MRSTAALFDQLHSGGAGDRLGHRRDPEHAVRRHRVVAAEVALAEGAFVDHAVAVRGDGDDAGNLAGLGPLPQPAINIGLVLHDVLPFRSCVTADDCFLRRSGQQEPSAVGLVAIS